MASRACPVSDRQCARNGIRGNGDGRINFSNVADALAPTADFLRQNGCREGEPNFAVIREWNAAKVCQQAITIMGKRIDG